MTHEHRCFDCGLDYGSPGFPDLIIRWEYWKAVSPDGEGNGLLCPNCICARLHNAAIRCEGAFMSGPIIAVSEQTMSLLSRVDRMERLVTRAGAGAEAAGVLERCRVEDVPR